MAMTYRTDIARCNPQLSALDPPSYSWASYHNVATRAKVLDRGVTSRIVCKLLWSVGVIPLSVLVCKNCIQHPVDALAVSEA